MRFDENRSAVLSLQQISKSGDPLAALRIDRSNRRRSGWLGKLVAVGLLLVCVAAGGWAWFVYGEELTRPQVKVASAEVRAAAPPIGPFGAGLLEVGETGRGRLQSRRPGAESLRPRRPGRRRRSGAGRAGACRR